MTNTILGWMLADWIFAKEENPHLPKRSARATNKPHSASENELDRHIIERLRVGETVALETVIRAYAARLIRFASDIVNVREVAEDVVQDVFIEMWNRHATLDPERSLKAYLYRAVKNRALNERKASQVRDRHRTRTEAAKGEMAAGAAAVVNPEDALVDVAAIQAIIASLSDRRREALRLRFEEGMTHVEIAAVLQISPEAAKRLVSRAIAEVRLRLIDRS